MSLPSWGRGLKLFASTFKRVGRIVAPFMGAWIETLSAAVYLTVNLVAPFMGAWIETQVINGKTFDNFGRSLHGGVD